MHRTTKCRGDEAARKNTRAPSDPEVTGAQVCFTCFEKTCRWQAKIMSFGARLLRQVRVEFEKFQLGAVS
ncbi:hypothetical protein [Rhodanobacter sp. C03]|uniref:hypothetical protein n=1 Tax=Rhodanobacter sp. C03 TaxID=1945858 RepID=UPI00143C2FEE|nr:hypothetical protein [Rhodanobacter sp. C03]